MCRGKALAKIRRPRAHIEGLAFDRRGGPKQVGVDLLMRNEELPF